MLDSPTTINYRQLHAFRYLIRRYLRFSEEAARSVGIEPQQHQLLLTVKGMEQSSDGIPVGVVAERLQINHNTAVELVDRVEALALVQRKPSTADHRRVNVGLTVRGEELLGELSGHHLTELLSLAPELICALNDLMAQPGDRSDETVDPGISG